MSPSRMLWVAGLSLGMFGCAANGPALNTASGRPEVFISGVTPQRVRAALLDNFLSRGWILERQTEDSISFITKAESGLAAVLLASNYDTQVMDRGRFTTISINGGTKIFASEEFVTNHGSAFEKVTPLHNNKNSNILQGLLERIKAKLSSSSDAASPREPKLKTDSPGGGHSD